MPKRNMILPAFGMYLSEVPDPESWILGGLPPTAPTTSGLQIDFAPLLLVDNVIMDRRAFTYLVSDAPMYLETIKQTLIELRDEGYLKLEDYAVALDAFQVRKDQTLDFHLRQPEVWLPEIRKQIESWSSIRSEFTPMLGELADHATVSTPFGIRAYLSETGKLNDRVEIERLSKAVLSTRINRTQMERDELRQVVKPYLSYCLSNIALQRTFDAPVYDWHDMYPFYSAINQANLSDDATQKHLTELDTIRRLFSVSIPQLRPRNAKQLLKAVRNSKVSRFRETISQLDLNHVDEVKFGSDLYAELLKVQIGLGKKTHIVAWTSRIVGQVPGASLVATPAELGVNKYLKQKSGLSEYDWLMCLIEAQL